MAVAPHTGAGIEIYSKQEVSVWIRVAPHTGAGIEIVTRDWINV